MTNLVFVPAAAMQEGTPSAATPAVIETAPEPTEAPQAAAPAATPAAAAPVPAAQTDVVTMVLWYANSANADILEIFPLATDASFVASPAAGAAVGTIDFPEDGSPPTIVIGENSFLTYPRADGVIERWTWLDDFEGARPATLVMQMSGQSGPYQNYYGTATMMSRDEGGAGGVLVVALRPPAPEAVAEQEAAAAEAPAEEAVVAEEVPAEEAVVTEEAPVEEAPVEDVIVVEEAPVEEVPAEVPADDGVIEVEPAG
jgi:hypothetical protein